MSTASFISIADLAARDEATVTAGKPWGAAVPAISTEATRSRRRAPKFAAALPRCLIAVCHREATFRLAEAAEQGGWQCALAVGAEAAQAHVQRHAFSLAVFDVAGAQEAAAEPMRDVLTDLAKRSATLVVLCGAEGDDSLEAWARSRGVWMYLPGTIDVSGLGAICKEARTITDRLRARGTPRRDVAWAVGSFSGSV